MAGSEPPSGSDDPQAGRQRLDGELETPRISKISNLVGDAMDCDSKSPLLSSVGKPVIRQCPMPSKIGSPKSGRIIPPPSQQLIIQFVGFLSTVAVVHSLENTDITGLETAFFKVFAADPPQTLFINIVQLIASHRLSSMHPSFLI
jgi:hypothetical protein